LQLYPKDILMHIINLVVLFALLRLILWKPVYRYLTARTDRVQADRDDAEKALLEAEEHRAEYERYLESVEIQGREIIRESQIKAEQDALGIIGEARDQAQTLISEAREKIENEKAQAITAARYEIAQLATDMAERILKREVTAGDSKSAVEDFFAGTR